MRKTVLTYGFLSGALAAILMLVTLTFVHYLGDRAGLVVGYTGIVLSLLFVLFGVRSYRDNIGGGRITFIRGFTVGILITLISCACYVATWEIVYFKFMPDFAEKYAAKMIEHAKASGASQQEIDKATQAANEFKVNYNKPWINIAYAFIEPFPVGLAMTLIAAAVFRRKTAVPEGASA